MFAKVIRASIALACLMWGIAEGATSSVSMSNLHGGSYSYAVDHDNYAAWYGSPHPQALPLTSVPTIGSLYGKDHSDSFSNYGTYSSGYGHGGYGHGGYGHATSYQNSNLKSYGAHKVYTGYGSGGYDEGSGYLSYHSNPSLSLYDESRKSYAEGYGHPISSINFNLKSYGGHPVYYEDHALDHGINLAHEYITSHDSLPHYYSGSFQSPEYGDISSLDVAHYGDQGGYHAPSTYFSEYPSEDSYTTHDGIQLGYSL